MPLLFLNILPAVSALWVLMAASMLVPALAERAGRDDDWVIFLVAAALVGVIGSLSFVATRAFGTPWRRREGILFVNVAWMTLSLVGALPFYLSDLDISFADAVFESVSGLTTTGSTVLVGLDDMPAGILMWRSMLQWFGGMGFVVIATFLLPIVGSGGQQLFTLESSDTSDKEFGRFREYAERMVLLYLGLTAMCFTSYLVLGMNAFDAINHALTTVSTGGFSTSDSSMGKFQSEPILWAASLFMLLSSLPFIYLIRLTFAGRHRADPQIAYFFGTVIGVSVFILLILQTSDAETAYRPFTTTVFHMVSVITTTGYAAEDYTLWHGGMPAIFFVITFLGGCSGSTAGGFKFYRIVIAVEAVRIQLRRIMHPHLASRPKYGSRALNAADLLDAQTFSLLYSASFAMFVLALQLMGLPLTESVSAAATALANVGPGLGPVIGPVGNFQSVPDAAKWLLSAAMLIGRLEILVVYALLASAFWRR